MAYEFSGATAKIVYRSATPPTTYTLMGWLKFNATSSATNPDWFRQSSPRITAGMRNGKSDMNFERTWTTGGVWRVTAANAVVTLTNWHFVAWRYDGSSTANDPTCWTGNLTTTPASRTVTRTTAPTGTITTAAGTMIVGSDDTSANNWGSGSIGWVSLHNALLTDAQVLEAWQYGYSRRAFSSALLIAPLIGSPENQSGTIDPGTVTAATVSAGPSIAPYGFWTPHGGSRDYPTATAAAAPAATIRMLASTGVGT